jgi:hypothetical protein
VHLFFESEVGLRDEALLFDHALRHLDQLLSQVLHALARRAAQGEEEADVLELAAELLQEVGVEVVQILLRALLRVQVGAHQNDGRSCTTTAK